MRIHTNTLAMALTALFIAGCAGAPSQPDTPEEQVLTRAEARWKALTGKDWTQAYGYFTPGHRSTVDESLFIRKMTEKRIQWEQARVLGASCPADRVCEVEVEVDYLMRQPMRGVDVHRGTRGWTETWIKVGEEWYYRSEA